MGKVCIAIVGLFLCGQCQSQAAQGFDAAFVNFESAPVHPIELSPDKTRLGVCNLADGKLEVFDVSAGGLIHLGSVPVGMDPVTVRFRDANEAWVINHISDSISVVDVASLSVRATVQTQDTPEDVVFAGTPAKAFVSCSLPNAVQVFDPDTRVVLTNLILTADRPRALAVSSDRQRVYAAIFESGNQTTIVGGKFRNLIFYDNVVSWTNGPYGGQNPPPNSGAGFEPPLTPGLGVPAPPSGLIVRKNDEGRWMDDNQGDWTEFVSGANASMTQRVPGWDLPDRDMAMIDATDFGISYATGLMNLCMALAVNPVSGHVSVLGTDAINEVRFEPNLNGIFIRVKLALVDPLDLSKTTLDLNPHLDYSAPTIPPKERDLSIGDPRAMVWTSDGARAYIAGMGSRNVVQVGANGARLDLPPIEVGDGPCGLALDESRQRLYVFNRFSCSLSVVDTDISTVINAIRLFDPTPLSVTAGRPHLYDTRRTSGLGQASCASCHVDARMDRLGWDLGNPAGDMAPLLVNKMGGIVTNEFHPMKGVMMTQTLQDIIGHEPFHWRGDRSNIQFFNSTYTNLQGAARALSVMEMSELRDFLASIRFPPNAYRHFDNSLSTRVPLPGHYASGENVLPRGAPLPMGNAVAGLELFQRPANFCVTCHTLPTGLGFEFAGGSPVSSGPGGEHLFPLAARLEGTLSSKIAQFRNLADKVGMDTIHTESRAGFGFGHDGSVDSMTRFLEGVRIVQDQDIADLTAFLFSVSGSDLLQQDAARDEAPPAAMGRQLTLNAPLSQPRWEEMLALARAPTSRVDLIAKGTQNGLGRGWVFQPALDHFQSDRQSESAAPSELLALAGVGTELTLTIVPFGAGTRLGIDRDWDGSFDRDEMDSGTDPADQRLLPLILGAGSPMVWGADEVLTARIPPLIAPGSFSWRKNGQLIAGQTNATLGLDAVSFEDAGDYTFMVTTPFGVSTSAVLRLVVAPARVTVLPSRQNVRRGSNALFSAEVEGVGPFQFQWRHNGTVLPGANEPLLLINDAQVSDEGGYQATALNPLGETTSSLASLVVLIPPALLVPPLNQRVVSGADVTFSFMISGHPAPFGYLLRRSSAVLTNYTSDSPMGFLTLHNAQLSDAGVYRIVITNAANPSPGLALDPVTLTVLLDSDNDGMPDEWELAHELNQDWAQDAGLDLDGDGQTNLQEYQSGTDPRDPGSLLRVDRIFLAGAGNSVVIQFNAAAGQGYTLETRDELQSGAWSPSVYFLPRASFRSISVTNLVGEISKRYYRLIPGYP